MLAACGSLETVPAKVLPPNTEEACDRAIFCGAFFPFQRPECLDCVDSVAAKWNEEVKALCGDSCPALKDVPCDVIVDQAHKTHLSECVVGRWWSP